LGCSIIKILKTTMGNLTNQYVSQSFQGLLKLDNSNTGVTSTLQYVTDGLGNKIPMQASTSSIVISGSFYGDGSNLTGITVNIDSGSLVTTSSFNAYTSSNDSKVNALMAATNSYITNAQTSSMTVMSASFATNSNSASYSSFAVSSSYADNAGSSISSSFAVNAGTSISSSFATNAISSSHAINSDSSISSSFAQNAVSASQAQNSVSASQAQNAVSSSQAQNAISASQATNSDNATSASHALFANNAGQLNGTGSGVFATTGSNVFQGTQTITGSLGVTGEITALSASITYLKTIYQTSSVIFTSGSNILGDEASDTQTLFGAVILPTGPLSVTGSATISGNLNAVTSLTASGLHYPTTDGAFSGQVLQTDAAGTLSFGNVNAVFETIRNGESTTITVGTPLYVSGSQGANPIVYRANAGDPTKMPVTFLAMENIASNQNGRGITLGLITGINMTGYPVGTTLWTDGLGALTNVRPTGSNDIIQPIGIVTKTGNGGQLNVLNPGPVLMPNMQTGYMFVGDGTNQPVLVASSSLSVASAVSSSQAQNAVSASHAINSNSSISSSFASNALSSSWSENANSASYAQNATSASQAQNAVSSSYATNALSASYAPMPDVSGFATTGSNLFKGTETIQSGNLIFKTPLNNSDYNVTSSTAGTGNNILFGNSTVGVPTGSLLLTGSNNIITAQYPATVGYNGYINGHGNFLLGSAGVLLSTASLLLPSISANIGGGNVQAYFTTSSLSGGHPIISNNYLQGFTNINIPSGSLTMQNNSVFSTLTFNSAVSTHNTRNTFTQNFVGAATTLNAFSSSIATANNMFDGALTINNHYTSSNTSGNQLALNRNAFFGNSHTLNISGSNDGSTNFTAFNDNLIAGASHIVQRNVTGTTSGSLVSTALIGAGLGAIATNRAGGNDAGTVIVGRWNDTGSLANSNQMVFAVGTGTAAATRRTGLFVTSGSLVGISGSLDVKGDSTLTGSLNITGALTVLGAKTILSGSNGDGVTLYASGTIQTQRLQFDGNPFNSNVASNLGALRLDSNNAAFIVSNYNKAETTSGSFSELYVSTGSNYVHSRQSADYAGTSASVTLSNANGTRAYTVVADNSVFTGSVQGAVNPLTVAASTASLNLNTGNFFELALTGSQDIHINPSNIKPGQTISIKLNTATAGTVSFPSSVKQASGSAYVPTSAAGIDVITLVSFDSSNLYLANIKNFI
jgi:hypothetical protein